MGKLGCFQKCCYNCWHILLGSGKEIAVIILFFFFFFFFFFFEKAIFYNKKYKKDFKLLFVCAFFSLKWKRFVSFHFLMLPLLKWQLVSWFFFNCSLFRWIKYCQYCKYIIVFSAMNWKAFSGCLEKKLNISSHFFLFNFNFITEEFFIDVNSWSIKRKLYLF